MSTFLVLSSNKPTVEQINGVSSNTAHMGDTLIIQSEDSKAIGIERAKELVKFAQKKPMSGLQKLAIIFDAYKMTDEAQNALLKTLEEHADFLDIVLVSKTENGILDTVISRCKKTKLAHSDVPIDKKAKKGEKEWESVDILCSSKIEERLWIAQNLAKLEKDEIVEILERWSNQAHKNGDYRTAELLFATASDIDELNVNTRLALEACFLKIN